MRTGIAIWLLVVSLSAHALTDKNAVPLWTAEKDAEAQLHNTLALKKWLKQPDGWSVQETAPAYKILRPVAEYEKAKYLIMSGYAQFSSLAIKQSLLRNLPEDMEAILYVDYQSEVTDTVNKFAPFIASQRLKVVVFNDIGSGFWARDAVPVPVFMQSSSPFGVTGAKYYHEFEPDQFIANLIGVPWQEHDFYFEGGNFLADSKGNCWVVNNARVQKIPDAIFSRFYACKSLHRLAHLKGIGHIDESVKFLSDTIALTDTPDYVDELKAAGFNVKLLPRPTTKIETYVNSLLVNGTIFVPVFDEATDALAINTYKSFGLKVVPVNSKSLSNDGSGSVHCITMTYP